MSVDFGNRALLPLLALILVPLIVHLFARTRPPVYRFSSLDFIRRLVRHTQRIKRPQDWLLWLLRTLAAAALVLLFLKPLLFAKHRLGGARVRRNVVVLVDASASMAWIENAQSRFAAACAEAASVLADLRAGDAANLIWLRSPPRAVFPAPGVNVAHLREMLRRGRVSSETADIREAVRQAADMLRNLPGRREICVVSDFQQSNWADTALDVPSDVDLFTIKVGAADGENVAVTRLTLAPAAPLAGEAAVLFAELRNFSPRGRQVSAFLDFREAREKQDCQIGAWGQATAMFPLRVPGAGEFPLTVRISEDEFAGDNTRYLLVKAQPFLRVGLLAAEPETAAAWRRALDAVGWARVETLRDAAGLAGAGLDLLMLSGWDGAAAGDVQGFLMRGGAVVWSPATNTPPAALRALGVCAGTSPQPVRWEISREAHRVTVARPADPCFAVFGGGEFGDPARGIFRGRLRLPPADGPQAATLMEYDDRVPALVRVASEDRSGGTLFLWNLPLQAAAGDWAGHPEFLPLFAEMVLTARTGLSPPARGDVFEPGQRLVRQFERDLLPGDVRLADESGRPYAVEGQAAADGVSFVSERAEEPGLYTWRAGDGPPGYSAVNFPSVESDLRTAAPRKVAAAGQALGGGRLMLAAQEGQPLWPRALACALAALTLEGFVALWARRT